MFCPHFSDEGPWGKQAGGRAIKINSIKDATPGGIDAELARGKHVGQELRALMRILDLNADGRCPWIRKR